MGSAKATFGNVGTGSDSGKGPRPLWFRKGPAQWRSEITPALNGAICMKLIRFFARLLPPPFLPLPEDPSVRDARIVRKIVQRNAEGNVRLSQGRYVTQKELDETWKRVSSLRF